MIVNLAPTDTTERDDKEAQLEQELMAESEYLKKREEAMDLERRRYSYFLDEWIAKTVFG